MAVEMDPATTRIVIPMTPADMTDRITPVDRMISLSHLGVPQITVDAWRLRIDGMVGTARTLDFDDLRAFPRHRFTAAHQCAGSPLVPQQPTQRVCNLTWTGARLADVLAACRPDPAARFLWSEGADHGSFAGQEVACYLKDLPLARVAEDVLLAYELNDAPLPPEAGYPVRLFVPGFYGTNSVKWLTRLHVASKRAPGPFTTTWYNDPLPEGGARPVWAIAPASCIVAPFEGGACAGATEIWGWAWGDGGIATVDVSTDGGRTWHPAEVEPVAGRGWQRFCLTRHLGPGSHVLMSRATGRSGEAQPDAGARNAVFSVTVEAA